MCVNVYTVCFSVCVSVCESKQGHPHAHERVREHPREGELHTREGRAERDDCKEIFFFPFLISNLLKIEATANSVLLNLAFSVEEKRKKNPLPKISTVNLN